MNKFILIFLLLNSAITYGTTANKLRIDSDDLVIDEIKKQANFTGEVILWFDDMILKTTNLEVFYKVINNKRIIDYINIPSKLTAKRNNDQELLIANTAQYFVDQKKLVLIGNVIVQNNNGIIQTSKLVYHAELRNIDF